MSRPGVKGEPGPAGLPGNKIDFFMIFIYFSFHV
jgi:hypothetical protein